MEWIAAFITIIVGLITVTWFIRDVRRENSKVLKSIDQTQKDSARILERQSEILAKIEEGQRRGFLALEQGQRALEQGQRIGFETLAKCLETQTKILAKIEAK